MAKATSYKVIELFEKHRKKPGADFDDSHFFDYLICKPKNIGAFRDSFSGLWRFNRLWDDLQLEFGICFSLKDREKNYSLSDFCSRIEQLKESKRSSISSLINREKVEFEWNLFISANILVLSVATLLTIVSSVFVSASAWLLVAFLNYVFISIHISEKKYVKKLKDKLLNEKNN